MGLEKKETLSILSHCEMDALSMQLSHIMLVSLSLVGCASYLSMSWFQNIHEVCVPTMKSAHWLLFTCIQVSIHGTIHPSFHTHYNFVMQVTLRNNNRPK